MTLLVIVRLEIDKIMVRLARTPQPTASCVNNAKRPFTSYLCAVVSLGVASTLYKTCQIAQTTTTSWPKEPDVVAKPKQILTFQDHVETAKVENPKRMCPCCGWKSSTSMFGPYGLNGRSDAQCPQCLALERHRTSCAVFGVQPELLDIKKEHDLKAKFDRESTGSLRMIYFGPHVDMARAVDHWGESIDQIWADFKDDSLYNRNRTTKTVHADLMNLQFPDSFAHGALILHVFEHIPDLPLAFAELKRILKPYSWILLEVPFRERTKTKDCRHANTDEERLECAGQKDHVWSFSIPDFEKELAKADLNCKDVHPMLLDALGTPVYDLFQFKVGTNRAFPQYLCRTPIN